MNCQMTRPWLSLAIEHEPLAMVRDPRKIGPVFVDKDDHLGSSEPTRSPCLYAPTIAAKDMPSDRATHIDRLGGWIVVRRVTA